MLAVAVVNNHEGGVGSGCGRSADEEDLLTRLRHVQTTLRECHWRLDRTDRWAESLFRNGEEEKTRKEDIRETRVNGREGPQEGELYVKEDVLANASGDKSPRRRGLVVKEGVCKESIIESEVVEELVLRTEWEDEFESLYDDSSVTDDQQREPEETGDATKEDRGPAKPTPRLERQDPVDEDDCHLVAIDTKPGSREQDVHGAEDSETKGDPEKSTTNNESLLPFPPSHSEGNIHSFTEGLKPFEKEYESLEPRVFNVGVSLTKSLPNLPGSLDLGLDSGLFRQLDFFEESLENLRLNFFSLKHAITHNTPEDSEFDLSFAEDWTRFDQKEPETQETDDRRDSELRNSNCTCKNIPTDKEQSELVKSQAPSVLEHQTEPSSCSEAKNDRLESADATDEENLCVSSGSQEKTPSSATSEEKGDGATSYVAEERNTKKGKSTDEKQCEDFQRCLITVSVVFFLLLLLLLLACYLLLVVPFVTVSYRHTEGTVVF
ncbi:uncharacterized protein LOC122264920 [Penaeus japonicus]|uniref:uncharacterized protein LOC122264920 n=1 Tax=Penaeus japonicus TaxID=27405 RepID=UPI001C715476|nr:uncharacterized protein LOC122264920 [Penaeus japonicus]XP_042889952.1 uncharacterized protein LOC122264920 [Penaeus japonicus]XP_042889953.1 uncharacterized protein LOC122264920 [Penaeus japonicus]XP_042889954.1 uncharacterized protein LOC122264920 [Penaeus japonicus]XP_042889956.1 uncharacterized protein LOC122264920 [Penaeus japonicus]XP_042889957.1 uncharacterized protein LOC122264920 [Penaeus japonicus]XP_042889958.1 uncharacterized protein LOC122264920 [Penaeus japonicus]XP_04288995